MPTKKDSEGEDQRIANIRDISLCIKRGGLGNLADILDKYIEEDRNELWLRDQLLIYQEEEPGGIFIDFMGGNYKPEFIISIEKSERLNFQYNQTIYTLTFNKCVEERKTHYANRTFNFVTPQERDDKYDELWNKLKLLGYKIK